MTIKYLCGIDYQTEMDTGLADFYDTIEELKDAKSACWGECGIVRIELDESGNEVGHQWVVKQDLKWE